MTPEVAESDHCTHGGTITSGAAVCNCGTWRASDYRTPADRKEARKAHLSDVLTTRKARP